MLGSGSKFYETPKKYDGEAPGKHMNEKFDIIYE